jgi:hypothetical protein
MPNTRRNYSGSVRLVPALKAVLLCALIASSCVGYVIQKNKIFDLGQQVGVRQHKLEKLKKENRELADRLATIQLPQRLAERVKELKLGLGQPQPSQILWIAEPSLWPPATNSALMQYVQSNSRP